jgi:hypothetical protein
MFRACRLGPPLVTDSQQRCPQVVLALEQTSSEKIVHGCSAPILTARVSPASWSTVRCHTKSIYSKLGVNSRRAAVTRAEQLGLMAPARTA